MTHSVTNMPYSGFNSRFSQYLSTLSDAVCDKKVPIYDGLKTTIGGKRVLITHGHNNDPNMYSAIAKAFVWFSGATIEPIFGAESDDFLGSIAEYCASLLPGDVGPTAADSAKEVSQY